MFSHVRRRRERLELAFSHLCGVSQERNPHGAHGGVRGDFANICSANVTIARLLTTRPGDRQ
jgi:hypothetical protein